MKYAMIALAALMMAACTPTTPEEAAAQEATRQNLKDAQLAVSVGKTVASLL